MDLKVKTANPQYMGKRGLLFGNYYLSQVLWGFQCIRQTEIYLSLKKRSLFKFFFPSDMKKSKKKVCPAMKNFQ